jgi:hypothetical protein
MNGIAPEPHSSAIARSTVVDANDAKAECLTLPGECDHTYYKRAFSRWLAFPGKFLFGFGACHPGKNFRAACGVTPILWCAVRCLSSPKRRQQLRNLRTGQGRFCMVIRVRIP